MATGLQLHDVRATLANAWSAADGWATDAGALLRSRYVRAVVFAVAALVVTRLGLDLLAGAHFVPPMGAICLAALLGGVGPGLVALGICAAGYPLVAAGDIFLAGLDLQHQITRFCAFLVVGLAEAIAAGVMWRAHAATGRASCRWKNQQVRQRHVRQRLREHVHVASITRDLAEGLVTFDPDGWIAFVNAAATRMLGWTEEELTGRCFHEVVAPHGSNGSPIRAGEGPFDAVLRGDNRLAQGQDLVFLRKDGTELPVSYTASSIVRRGRVVGVALTFQDFSAHLRAEECERFIARATQALTESIDWEATLKRVAQLAVPFLGDWCLVVLDDERGLRTVAAADADAAKADAIRDLLERYPLDRDAQHGVGRIVRTASPEIVPEVDIETFVTERGDRAQLRGEILRTLGLRSYMGVPLVARGRTLGAIAFGVAEGPRRFGARDLAIAEELAGRCALAIDNARLYREAQQATRDREEVLAVVSHDLRGPIGAVQIAAGLLARRVRESGPPEMQRTLDTVKRATSRAARLVDDLVDSARLQRGKLVLDRAPHDAASLAQEAIAVLEPLAHEQGVSLTLDTSSGGGVADCDHHRVLQVLANLLGNALKVTPSNAEIRVRTWREGGEVMFTVADTGPGIAAQDLPHIFDRYWRGANTKYDGSGLGLAIARGVVEAHGGHISVRSAPGEGTTFTFSLPASSAPTRSHQRESTG